MYFLLLTDKKLAIFECKPYDPFNLYRIPPEVYKYMTVLKKFDDRLDLDLYLAQKLTFDDYYEFHAEYGILEGKIYRR